MVGRILHDCPALQGRLRFRARRAGVKHQPVARLPEWRLLHVAHADLSGPLAREGKRHRLLLVVVPERQHREGFFQFALQPGIQQPQPRDRVERQRPQTIGREDRDELPRDCLVVADRHDPRLHSHDRARDRRRRIDFDLLTAQPAEQIAHRGIVGELDGEGVERLGDRITRRVAHRRRRAAGILDHHALEQIIDFFGLERHLHRGIVRHLAGVLKGAHARREQHDLLERQRRLGGRHVGQPGGHERQGHNETDDAMHGLSPEEMNGTVSGRNPC